MINGLWALGLFGVMMFGSSVFAADSAGFKPSPKAVEYRNEGYRLQEQGDLDQAIVYYRKAARVDRKYPAPHNDLGIIYEQKGLLKSAEKSYLKAIDADKRYKGAYSNLAALYESKGELQKSIYYWKKRLGLEKGQASTWSKKAQHKIEALRRRLEVHDQLDDELPRREFYESKKKKGKFKGWKKGQDLKDVEEGLADRYYEKEREYYHRKQYKKAVDAFRVAKSYRPNDRKVSQFIVKAQRMDNAISDQGELGQDEYKGIVADEDLLLARDHFRMGLDYFAKQDFQRAYSSFTIAMTYNPYSETILRYVEDAKVKIEQQKLQAVQIKEDLRTQQYSQGQEALDVVKEMIDDKEDVMNKGYVTSLEDMSVEGFMKDGKELFMRKQYGDALYVWQQAELLDVSGLYTEELAELIAQARRAAGKQKNQQYNLISDGVEYDQMAEVTRAAIPSAEGAPEWARRAKKVIRHRKEEVSKDRQELLDRLKIKYTLSFKDASLKSIVDLLTELTSLNIIIDTKEIEVQEVERKHISFKVNQMPLIDILKAVLRFTDYDYLIQDHMIWITTKEKIKTEDLVLMVYDVQDIVGKLFDFPSTGLGGDFGATGNDAFRTEDGSDRLVSL